MEGKDKLAHQKEQLAYQLQCVLPRVSRLEKDNSRLRNIERKLRTDNEQMSRCLQMDNELLSRLASVQKHRTPQVAQQDAPADCHRGLLQEPQDVAAACLT